MSEPTATRRVLLKGLSVDQVTARVRAYEQLDDPGEAAVTLVVRGPTEEGWIQVDLPLDLPEFHTFNLTKWFEGDEDHPEAPEQLMLVQQGGAVAFWAKPATADGGSSVLSGRTDDRRRFAYDLAQLQMVDDARFDAPPMSVAMAMMTAGVPVRMHAATAAPEPVTRLDFTPFDVERAGASPLVTKVLGWLFGKS